MVDSRFPPVGRDNHPDDDLLSQYIDDRCSPRQRRAIEEHLTGCQSCRDRLADLLTVVAMLGGARSAPAPRSFRLGPEHRRPTPPANVPGSSDAAGDRPGDGDEGK
jgi:anti-sigma factor RsiW